MGVLFHCLLKLFENILRFFVFLIKFYGWLCFVDLGFLLLRIVFHLWLYHSIVLSWSDSFFGGGFMMSYGCFIVVQDSCLEVSRPRSSLAR